MPKWRISGDFIDSCSCQVPCKSNWILNPTSEHRQCIYGFHIRNGEFAHVKLDGLSLAFVAEWDERKNGWVVGILMDKRAEEMQKQTLQIILIGKAGGVPAMIISNVRTLVGIEYMPIEFKSDARGSSWSLAVGNGGKIELKAIEDDNVTAAKRNGRNESALGSAPVTFGRATVSRVNAYDWHWDFSGRSCKHQRIDWKGP